MYEVLDASINLHLNDQEAIRGVERVRGAVKRNLKAIERDRAKVIIEGDLSNLKRALKEEEALLKARQKKVKDLEKERADLAGAALGWNTRRLKAAKEELETSEKQVASDRKRVDAMKGSLGLIKERHKFEQLETRELREHEKLERSKAKAARDAERAKIGQAKQDVELAKLQERYIKAGRELNKIEQERSRLRGRFRSTVSPAIKQEVEVKRAKAIGEMKALKAELEAMGAKPVEIHTELDRRGGLGALANLGDIGTRIGPFSGTLAQFAKASLILGPAIMGLVGAVGALAGAIGTGLTGALGIGAAAVGAFGLSLGGVGLLTVSLMRDFKNLNTLQDAYHKQVLKTGANSDKAKTKLEEFNHALGEVTPTTREAFLNLDKLQDRWRGLRSTVKPDFLNALGETFTTINADFDVFSRHTVQAFKRVSSGWTDWMQALRSDRGKEVIGQLMHEANAAIPPLMRGLGDLAAAGAKVSASFGRFLRPMLEDFAEWAHRLNMAADNTTKLDQGTGRLYRSFRQTLDVVTAFSNVIKEFALTAMGPGGKMMEDMAGGLNDLADGIAADRVGENRLGKFLKESVNTTEQLYQALQPLLKLFVEWSTALRPVTNIMLDVVEALGKFLNLVVDKVPGAHALLAGMGTLWLFRRTPAAALTTLAQALNLVAAGFMRVGKAQKAAAGLQGAASALSARAAGGAAAGSAGGSAAGAAGGSLVGNALRGIGGIGRGAMVAGAIRGGAAGALTQSITRGLGGTLLSGIMRAGIWTTIGVGIFKGIKTGLDHGIRAGAQDALSSITFGLLPKHKDYAAIDRKITEDIDRIEELAQQRAEAKKLGINLDVNFKTDKATGSMKLLLAQIERTRTGMAGSLGQARSDLEMNMKAISTTMDVNSHEGKQAVAANFRAVAAEIKRGIKSGAIDTEAGMKAIHGYLVQALTTLGLSKGGAELYLKHRDPLTGSKQGGKYTPKAVGGWIGRPGQRGTDQIPLLVGKGEAVLNRHQQLYVQAGLQAIGIQGGLSELFQKENTPHYMNRGGFTGAATGHLPNYQTHQGGTLGQVTQGAVNQYHNAAEKKLREAVMAESVADTAGSTHGLTARVKRAIAWARTHGWHGSVTSGFRSYAEQAVLYARYLAGGNIAAKPGHSNHERGLAIDVSDYAAFNRAMQSAPANAKLKWYGPGDPVHFSVDGHARGGFVGAARGKAPSLRGQVLSKILKRAPGLSIFNKQFKSNGGESLSPDVIRAIAEAAGFSPTEALHMMQISKGESTRQPGAISKDGGYGLLQMTPRTWGSKAKGFLAKLGGTAAMLNPLLNMVMARYLYNDRKRSGKDPLGPWYGTKYLNRASRAKGSILPQFQTKGSYDATNAPRTHGPRMDLANILALNEANVGRAGRTTNLADDIWTAGVQIQGLRKQNKASRGRIKTIDKALKGRLTSDQRSNLLSERAGLIGGIESNKQSIFDKRKEARDKLFELQRGPGGSRTDIDYAKAVAESTDTIDDDLKVAKADVEYWTARVAFLKKNKASQADITEAQNNLNGATKQVTSLQDQQKSDLEDAKRLSLSAASAQASLTSDMGDDLLVAQDMQSWVQGMYDLAVATNDTAGIAKWGPELKSANEDVASIKESIALLGPQLAQVGASLTNDLNDDVSAAQGLVDYWQGIYDSATGAEKVSAGGNLAGARSDLKSAQRNAELLPLERNAALAALTDTLDDDKAATIALRDYWAKQLENAKQSGDIPAQIEAANNLAGLNDQIKNAERSVMEQMIVLSEARRDLYKSFANNLISSVPQGTLSPGGSTTYNNAGTTVNVTNNFQTPPDDPHTWSAGVAWELQAAV